MFSLAWHQVHVFPRLAPGSCFYSLGTRFMFSRAWYQMNVFLRLVPSACCVFTVRFCPVVRTLVLYLAGSEPAQESCWMEARKSLNL